MHLADRRSVLTPDALALVDAIARTGSFAGAARELGKVPSALTYSVRQLEEALDVLLFDRSARHAVLTAAGQELLVEGRRLLMEIDAVTNRVKRIATGWEADNFEVAVPVTVLERQVIERRMADNAADLLREETGVDVNGVGPNQERPIIRGLRGLRVLFMENGLKLNNARRQTDFGEVTGLVAVDDLDRVEVVRGPASVLYGSDAIGGGGQRPSSLTTDDSPPNTRS